MSYFDDFWKDAETRPSYQSEFIKLRLAKIIETAMDNKSMTQLELADKIGKTKNYVHKLLCGDVNLSILDLAKLGIALGVNFKITLEDK